MTRTGVGFFTIKTPQWRFENSRFIPDFSLEKQKKLSIPTTAFRGYCITLGRVRLFSRTCSLISSASCDFFVTWRESNKGRRIQLFVNWLLLYFKFIYFYLHVLEGGFSVRRHEKYFWIKSTSTLYRISFSSRDIASNLTSFLPRVCKRLLFALFEEGGGRGPLSFLPWSGPKHFPFISAELSSRFRTRRKDEDSAS